MIFSKLKGDIEKIINRITRKSVQTKIKDGYVRQNGLWSEKIECVDTFVDTLSPDLRHYIGYLMLLYFLVLKIDVNKWGPSNFLKTLTCKTFRC
jgi:hypothetical protein